jgi:hypothetical protein
VGRASSSPSSREPDSGGKRSASGKAGVAAVMQNRNGTRPQTGTAERRIRQHLPRTRASGAHARCALLHPTRRRPRLSTAQAGRIETCREQAAGQIPPVRLCRHLAPVRARFGRLAPRLLKRQPRPRWHGRRSGASAWVVGHQEGPGPCVSYPLPLRPELAKHGAPKRKQLPPGRKQLPPGRAESWGAPSCRVHRRRVGHVWPPGIPKGAPQSRRGLQ